MASLFYREDRDIDFFNTCEKIRQESDKHLSVAEIVRNAIQQPAKSFYIHKRVYIKIIRNNGSKLPKNNVSRELHIEVLKRAKEIMSQYSDYTPAQVATILIDHDAPRFYISEARAESLYYQLLK